MSGPKPESPANFNEFMAKANPIDLVLFEQVAKELSITRAAQKMGDMLESTASKRIKRLEELLGSRLFERSSRQLSLSEDGHAYVTQISRLLENYREMYRLTQMLQSEEGGVLRLGGGSVFIEFISREFIGQFVRNYPEIRLEICQVPYDELESHIAQLDLIIIAKLPASQSIGLRKLGSYQIYFWASPEYLQEHGRPNHPRELVEHTFLTVRDKVFGTHCIPWVDEQGNLYRDPITHPFICDSSTTLLNLTLQGFGVLAAPLLPVKDVRDQLDLLFDGKYAASFDLYAIFPSARLMPQKTKVLLKELETYFKSLPTSI